jgi:hypothetical protein
MARQNSSAPDYGGGQHRRPESAFGFSAYSIRILGE